MKRERRKGNEKAARNFNGICRAPSYGRCRPGGEVEIQPYYMVNWGKFEPEYSNVYEMPYFWAYGLEPGDTEGRIAWNHETNIDKLVQNLKEEFDSRPAGTRYINFCLPSTAFHDLVEDVVFMDKAVAVVQSWLREFLLKYKEAGGQLDGLVVDVEYLNVYAIYIHSRFFGKDKFVYKKIMDNPLYAERIRPELEARGFQFYEPVSDYTPEIYGIHPSAGAQYSQCDDIWDAVMRSYLNTSVTEACAPVWEYYPDAIVSDYQSKNIKSWMKELNDAGTLTTLGGNYTGAGNSNNENTYSVRPYNFFTSKSDNTAEYKTVAGYNRALFENNPFFMFQYDANLMKNTYIAADGEDVSFWISTYRYNQHNKNSVSFTPYYTETLLHMGMLDPSAYLGYIIESEVGYQDDYELSLKIINDIMAELTRVVGAADRKPIDVIPNWNNYYVLSGMNAGGKNIWRLTPNTYKVALEDFQVEGAADLTFSVLGQTITFPQGKIIENGEVTEVGTCGYWIETPADVVPVASRTENYYSTYPAYGEDYDGFEVGTEYNFNTALPAACWEVKKVGDSSAIVQADPADASNQVLALKGTYTLKNVKMPKNITAGDTYAENQAWEVQVTIPGDMAEDAELVLLNAGGAKKKTNDGGFKVIGTKVYYSQNGEYAEMSGVKLIPGSKYTFLRQVELLGEDACTSDYYVLDAAGKLLGSAKDIAMGTMEIPVASISMSCTGVTGEAVLLDNYKLYPTGVTAEFALYDAKTGMEVTDPDTPRSGDTAYRLSWMNTTNTVKTYKVMAAYYQGDQLVEEKEIFQVQLSPNTEGVETGVVEAAEGQSIRIYLQSVEEPAGNVWMIVIICAGVVLAAGAVALVIWKKKKKEEE